MFWGLDFWSPRSRPIDRSRQTLFTESDKSGERGDIWLSNKLKLIFVKLPQFRSFLRCILRQRSQWTVGERGGYWVENGWTGGTRRWCSKKTVPRTVRVVRPSETSCPPRMSRHRVGEGLTGYYPRVCQTSYFLYFWITLQHRLWFDLSKISLVSLKGGNYGRS